MNDAQFYQLFLACFAPYIILTIPFILDRLGLKTVFSPHKIALKKHGDEK